MANTDMRRRLAMMLGDCQVTIKGVPPITTARRRLLSLKAFGGTEQNGTPTPTNPIDIVSNNGVLKVSPNLYNGNFNYTATGTGQAQSISFETFFVAPTTTALTNLYTVSCDVESTNVTYSEEGNLIFFSLLYDDGTSAYIGVTTTNYMQSRISFLSNPAKKLVSISYLRIHQRFTGGQITVSNLQIEEGGIATTYMPYGQIYADGTVETINVHGKNLFDINSVAVLGVRYTLTVVGNNIEAVAGRNTNTASRISIFIPVSFFKENTTYYFNSKSDTSFNINRCTIGKSTPDSTADSYYYDTISQKENNGYSGSFTITDIAPDQEYVSIFYYLGEQDENTRITISDIQIEQGSTATPYAPYYDGGTATAEMLLKVGNFQDVQSVLDGVVTRNVGVKVFDGTENWVGTNNQNYFSLRKTYIQPAPLATSSQMFCTHLLSSPNFASQEKTIWMGISYFNINYNNAGGGSSSQEMATFKQWLADQYAAGTPVIVVYPIATPATEQVSGQTLTLTNGTNVIDITQASLDNLELEVKVK